VPHRGASGDHPPRRVRGAHHLARRPAKAHRLDHHARLGAPLQRHAGAGRHGQRDVLPHTRRRQPEPAHHDAVLPGRVPRAVRRVGAAGGRRLAGVPAAPQQRDAAGRARRGAVGACVGAGAAGAGARPGGGGGGRRRPDERARPVQGGRGLVQALRPAGVVLAGGHRPDAGVRAVVPQRAVRRRHLVRQRALSIGSLPNKCGAANKFGLDQRFV
jgi:hypothetical protein